MGIFSYFKKAKPKEPEISNIPRLTFELHEDATVVVSCSWPTPTNAEEAAVTVHQYSLLVHLINSGRMIGAIQQAIGNFNHGDKIGSKMSKAILTSIQQVMRNNGDHVLDDSNPVVSPREVFMVRGNND
jgi:hypothetical protein